MSNSGATLTLLWSVPLFLFRDVLTAWLMYQYVLMDHNNNLVFVTTLMMALSAKSAFPFISIVNHLCFCQMCLRVAQKTLPHPFGEKWSGQSEAGLHKVWNVFVQGENSIVDELIFTYKENYYPIRPWISPKPDPGFQDAGGEQRWWKLKSCFDPLAAFKHRLPTPWLISNSRTF